MRYYVCIIAPANVEKCVEFRTGKLYQEPGFVGTHAADDRRWRRSRGLGKVGSRG